MVFVHLTAGLVALWAQLVVLSPNPHVLYSRNRITDQLARHYSCFLTNGGKASIARLSAIMKDLRGKSMVVSISSLISLLVGPKIRSVMKNNFGGCVVCPSMLQMIPTVLV